MKFIPIAGLTPEPPAVNGISFANDSSSLVPIYDSLDKQNYKLSGYKGNYRAPNTWKPIGFIPPFKFSGDVNLDDLTSIVIVNACSLAETIVLLTNVLSETILGSKTIYMNEVEQTLSTGIYYYKLENGSTYYSEIWQIRDISVGEIGNILTEEYDESFNTGFTI